MRAAFALLGFVALLAVCLVGSITTNTTIGVGP